MVQSADFQIFDNVDDKLYNCLTEAIVIIHTYMHVYPQPLMRGDFIIHP